jgi:hypothetical protein
MDTLFNGINDEYEDDVNIVAMLSEVVPSK